MNKTLITIITVAVVVGIGAFYGGMKYAQSKTPGGLSQTDFQNLRNLSPDERQQRLEQLDAARGTGFRGGGLGTEGGFLAGEIISKDDKSITIKLRDGSSRIVFYSETTEINRFVSVTANELEKGKSVVVNGKVNQEGTVTAQSIQVRPLDYPQ